MSGPAAELPTPSPASRRHAGCNSRFGSSNVIRGSRRAAPFLALEARRSLHQGRWADGKRRDSAPPASTATLLFDCRDRTIKRMKVDVQLVSLITAVWGAITGTTALTLSLVTFFTERARLKLAWLRGFVMLTVGPLAPATESKEQYARLIVTNLGRKPLRITSAYGMHLDETGALKMFLFSDAVVNTSKDRVLTPENPITDFIVREDVIPAGLFLLAVNDGFGKTHRLWLVPRFKRFGLRRKIKKTLGGKLTV